MSETIAQRLLAARAAAKLTQSELAEAAGTQWQQISRWERGAAQPRVKATGALAHALGVCELWLRTGDGPMFPPLETPRFTDQLANESSEPGAMSFGNALLGMASQLTPQQEALPSIDASLLELALRAALETAPHAPPGQLAAVIASAYDAALKSGRAHRIEDVVRAWLS